MNSADLVPRDPAAVLADLATDDAVADRVSDATVETQQQEVYVNTEVRQFFPTENVHTEQLRVSEHDERLEGAVPITDRYQPEHVPTDFTRLRVDVCDASPPQIDCPECEDTDTGTITCPDCSGTTWAPCTCRDGRTTCSRCNGTKQRRCSHCRENGTRQCGACSGSGEESCSQCGGDGSIQCKTCAGNGQSSTQASCPTCGGDTEWKCQNCDGRGYHHCQRCTGSIFGPARGSIACPTCSGDDDECTRCRDDGTITCPDCAGDARRRCPDCQNGTRRCPDCSNTPQACSDCGGTGSKRCPACEGKTADCDRCHGSGERDCRECNGTTQVACDRCDSRGEAPHSQCEGKGEVPCDCGDGRVECTHCEGEGILLETTHGKIQYEIETIDWTKPDPGDHTPFSADRPRQQRAVSYEATPEGPPGPDTVALRETTEISVPMTAVEYSLDGTTYAVVDYGGTIAYEAAPVSTRITQQRRRATELKAELEPEIERRRAYLTDRVQSHRKQLQTAMWRVKWIGRIEIVGGLLVGLLALYGASVIMF